MLHNIVLVLACWWLPPSLWWHPWKNLCPSSKIQSFQLSASWLVWWLILAQCHSVALYIYLVEFVMHIPSLEGLLRCLNLLVFHPLYCLSASLCRFSCKLYSLIGFWWRFVSIPRRGPWWLVLFFFPRVFYYLGHWCNKGCKLTDVIFPLLI